jgi:FAD/FMN-containing dehydrogenase
MTEQAIAALQQNLRGRVIQPGDPDYDSARALYNGMIDKRPRLIARCVDVADVITAVNFARENGVLLAIRGGGHNGPGLGSCNDGLVIDLSMMKSVRVDPATKTVRVEGGCTSGDPRIRTCRSLRDRLDHGDRRLDAWRGHRLLDAQVRADDR